MTAQPQFVTMVPLGSHVTEGTSAWHSHGYKQFFRFVYDGEWKCSGCGEPMSPRVVVEGE
jgi:hypothetical protein